MGINVGGKPACASAARRARRQGVAGAGRAAPGCAETPSSGRGLLGAAGARRGGVPAPRSLPPSLASSRRRRGKWNRSGGAFPSTCPSFGGKKQSTADLPSTEKPPRSTQNPFRSLAVTCPTAKLSSRRLRPGAQGGFLSRFSRLSRARCWTPSPLPSAGGHRAARRAPSPSCPPQLCSA